MHPDLSGEKQAVAINVGERASIASNRRAQRGSFDRTAFSVLFLVFGKAGKRDLT